jgi:hypothetical protein
VSLSKCAAAWCGKENEFVQHWWRVNYADQQKSQSGSISGAWRRAMWSEILETVNRKTNMKTSSKLISFWERGVLTLDLGMAGTARIVFNK